MLFGSQVLFLYSITFIALQSGFQYSILPSYNSCLWPYNLTGGNLYSRLIATWNLVLYKVLQLGLLSFSHLYSSLLRIWQYVLHIRCMARGCPYYLHNVSPSPKYMRKLLWFLPPRGISWCLRATIPVYKGSSAAPVLSCIKFPPCPPKMVQRSWITTMLVFQSGSEFQGMCFFFASLLMYLGSSLVPN